MAGIEPDWTSISEDLLFFIVKLFPTRIDILRLRAVCRSFRARIPPPSILYPFPHSILTATDFLKGPDRNQNDAFALQAFAVYAVEPFNKIPSTQGGETPQTWVVKVFESNSGVVQVIDLMTDEYCEDLSDKLPKSFNLLDYRVTEIGKFYYLYTDTGSRVAKVVFSSFLDEHDDEFAVIASCSGMSEAGMWRNVDKKWRLIDFELSLYEYIEDIIYCNDKFYALSTSGRIVTVDSKSLIVTQVAAGLRFNRSFSWLSLVVSFNELFLLGQYQDDDDDEYHIEVFKLNEKKREWVRVVDGLDLIDRVFFVGETSLTFSVSVKEFLGFKGGCVYYEAESSDDDNPAQHIWVRDFDSGKFGPISVFPGYLNFFWPPPAWLVKATAQGQSC